LKSNSSRLIAFALGTNDFISCVALKIDFNFFEIQK
jgi:hypothetical protein